MRRTQRLSGIVLRTPLLPFRDDAWIKPESLQPTGSFKIRGGYNALAKLSPDERARGVVVHSSGNHAQAIARAARLLGIRAVVVMPDNAPDVKVAGVRADGGEIVFVGPHNVERVAKAHEIADEQGLVLVSSANHIDVVAGQGTIGFEIADQLLELGVTGGATVLTPDRPGRIGRRHIGCHGKHRSRIPSLRRRARAGRRCARLHQERRADSVAVRGHGPHDRGRIARRSTCADPL